MVFFARSWLSQKDGSPILSVNWARSACLPATSKRVSQLGQPGGQVIDAAAQVGVHQALLEGPPVATGGFYDKHSNAGRQFGFDGWHALSLRRAWSVRVSATPFE